MLAKQGDEDALRQIMEQYRNLINRVTNSYYIVGGDKEDILQECMVGVFSAVCSYDESKGAFPSFVKMCIMRRVLSIIDKDSSLKSKPLSGYVELSAIAEVEGGHNPLDILIDREVASNLRQAIDTLLTPAERDVLLLFVEGYSYLDISAKLGITYKSVDGKLQKAKKKLSNIKE